MTKALPRKSIGRRLASAFAGAIASAALLVAFSPSDAQARDCDTGSKYRHHRGHHHQHYHPGYHRGYRGHHYRSWRPAPRYHYGYPRRGFSFHFGASRRCW